MCVCERETSLFCCPYFTNYECVSYTRSLQFIKPYQVVWFHVFVALDKSAQERAGGVRACNYVKF